MCALAVAGLAFLVKTTPYIPLDAASARAIQSIDLGPLTSLFPLLSWAGGPGGLDRPSIAVALANGTIAATDDWHHRVVLIDRRTKRIVWEYGHLGRARPTLDQVLQITEHPGASSFRSGHVIFSTINLGVLMLCVGYRYLPGWGRRIAWLVLGAVVLLVAVSRVYVGAHWPLDVVASVLVAAGWLCLVVSIRTISNGAFVVRPGRDSNLSATSIL